MPTKKKGVAPRGAQQADSLTLTDLEQVKVLADPLRIRILEELCDEERTTKQVAQRLGEKPTKLYHHVEALERVGLIRLVRTRQNRGTMEKYYLGVARQFRADSRIFSASSESPQAKKDAVQSMITTIFDSTADEMLGLLARGRGRKGVEEKGVLSYLEIRTDPKDARRIQAQLEKLIQSFEKGEEKPGAKRYRFTLAFYPIDPDS